MLFCLIILVIIGLGKIVPLYRGSDRGLGKSALQSLKHYYHVDAAQKLEVLMLIKNNMIVSDIYY